MDERRLVRSLFESYYDPSVYCTEPRYFDWLHLHSPGRAEWARDDEFTALAAIDGERLLGCINYVPTSVYIDGAPHSAAVTAESLAHPESGGAYGLLARRLVGRFDYCFMMGATELLQTMYVKQLGARYHHEMRRRILFGDVESLRLLLAQSPDELDVDVGQLQAWSDAAKQFAACGRWVAIEDPGRLRDDYWQALLASGVPCIRRDPEWLRWRYVEHPHVEYQIIAAEAEQASGIAVVRRESVRGLECHAVRLLEFLPTAGAEQRLAEAVAAYAVDSQCALLDFFCASDAWLDKLPAAFVRTEEHGPHQIPYLLQPPEWRARRSINLLSTLNRRKRRVLPPLDGGLVYLTKGDGAQDIALSPGYRSAHMRQNPTQP